MENLEEVKDMNFSGNRKLHAVQFLFAIADAKWHRGETPSPGGNLPSNRYLTRHFYSCNVRVRMLCVLNWQAHIFLSFLFSFVPIVLCTEEKIKRKSIFFYWFPRFFRVCPETWKTRLRICCPSYSCPSKFRDFIWHPNIKVSGCLW